MVIEVRKVVTFGGGGNRGRVRERGFWGAGWVSSPGNNSSSSILSTVHFTVSMLSFNVKAHEKKKRQ